MVQAHIEADSQSHRTDMYLIMYVAFGSQAFAKCLLANSFIPEWRHVLLWYQQIQVILQVDSSNIDTDYRVHLRRCAPLR